MEQRPRPLAINIASLAASEITSRVLALGLLVYIARVLGVAPFGQLAFALAATSYVTLFSDFGLTSLGIREIAKSPQEGPGIATGILVLQLLASGLAVGALLLVLLVLPIQSDTKVLTAVLGFAAFPAALDLAYVFQARERMEYGIMSRLSGQVIYVASGVLLVTVYRSVVVVAFVTVLGATITSITTVALLRSRLDFRFTGTAHRPLRHLFLAGLPFLTSAVMVQVYTNADSFILQFTRGAHALGIYSAPYRLMLLIPTAGGFASRAFYPRLARTFTSDRAAFDRLVAVLARVLASVGIPIAALGIIFAREIINLVYGHAYSEGATVLMILMLLPPLMLINSTIGYSLDSSGHQRRSAVGSTLAAAGNVGLNLIAIPKFGFYGAAWVTVATEVFLVFWLAAYERIDLGINIVLLFLRPRPMFACALMALVAILSPAWFGAPLRGLSAFFAYIVAMLTLGGLRAEDLRAIRGLTRRIRQ